jgi:hypothetical protein
MSAIGDLISDVNADPWNRVKLQELLDRLQVENNAELLEQYRKTYIQRFAPDGDFWRSWLADKIIAKDAVEVV